jgi:S1-C subfamily serine protease
MFKNSLGTETYQEEAIFPLVTYFPAKNIWRCVGTGFFIQGYGGFVTAKHVFFDNNDEHLPTLFAVQTTPTMERHIRILKHFVAHPDADIAVGFLGKRRLKGGADVTPEIAASFILNFEKLNVGDRVRTYAFPLTQTENLGEGQFEFTFAGKWADGDIVDIHEEGSPLVRNRCYQTTMKIEHGASGGPVLKNDLVVGINSSSMTLPDGEVPISFVTPIDLILDLSVPNDDKMISIRDLVANGSITAKRL